MKKRFVLLIDFSKYSKNLVHYACDWSKQVDADILLMHQTQVLSPAIAHNKHKQQISHDANKEAIKKLKKLAKDLIPETINVSFSVEETRLQNRLAQLSTTLYDNLIFVGLKEKVIFEKLFISSMTLQVIDKTQNIVVAMPKDISTFSHERIFVAVTDKHPLNIDKLNNFLKFIENEDTSLTFFYLAKPHEKTKQIENQLKELSEAYADRFNTSFAVYEGSQPFDDIKKVINNNIEEMLVVQRGSRLLTDKLFRKFLINDLVYEGQTPLIVLP